MDEEIKKEFDKVWAKIKELEESFINPQKIEKTPDSEEEPQLLTEIEIFCKNFGIEKDKLRYMINFQENYPRLTSLPKREIRTKLQLDCLLILGLIYVKIYRKDLSEKIVRDLFDLSRVTAERMDKLYSSKDFSKCFSKSGTNIKLSWAGEQEAIKTIKELKDGKKD